MKKYYVEIHCKETCDRIAHGGYCYGMHTEKRNALELLEAFIKEHPNMQFVRLRVLNEKHTKLFATAQLLNGVKMVGKPSEVSNIFVYKAV